MQLSKRFQFIISISFIFIVFSSILCYRTQIESQNTHNPQVSQSNGLSPDIYVYEVNRQIIVNQHDITTVADSFLFVNNGSTPLNYIYYTVNDTYLAHLLGLYAKTPYESTLSHQLSQNSLFGYRTYIIYLNTPILPKSNQSVVVITAFQNLYRAQFNLSTSNQMVFFNFSLWPFSPYYIYEGNTTVSFPYRTFFDDYSGDPNESGSSLYYSDSEILPFTEEIFNVKGRNNQYSSLRFTEIVRRIHIHPWGYIRVIENHKLKNTGDLYIKIYEIKLPISAHNVTMYDEIGTIDGGTFNTETGIYSVNLQNRAGINPNATKRYTLEYHLPLEEFFSRSYTTSSLKMDLNLMNYGMLIENQHTYLYLYAGKSIRSTTLVPDSISYFDNSMVLYYHHTNVIGYHDYYLLLEYKEGGFQLIARALLFSMIAIVLFSSYTILRSRRKSTEDEEVNIREEIIPESEMREFISNYEEITAVRIDIKNLEEDLARKKIAKKMFSQQLKVLESKLKTTQEDIKPFKKIILSAGGQIAEIVKRLDLREAELISNQDSIKLYDERYKKGKLPSKQAYRTLRTQMEDNGEKIQRQIDRLINQMKAYLI